jgi:hypothetical protein
VGRCKKCRYWATMDGKVGDCTAAEDGPAESLHVAVVWRREPGSGCLFGRYSGDEYKGGLQTDGEFGCTSFDQATDGPDQGA